jgi:hypothetical protein
VPDGALDLGMVGVAQMAQGGGEVGRADEQAVNALDSRGDPFVV